MRNDAEGVCAACASSSSVLRMTHTHRWARRALQSRGGRALSQEIYATFGSTVWARTASNGFLEVLAHGLQRRLEIIRAAGEPLGRRKLLGYDRTAAEMFGKAAEHAPAEFVKHVLPVVLEISDSARDRRQAAEVRCRVVGSRLRSKYLGVGRLHASRHWRVPSPHWHKCELRRIYARCDRRVAPGVTPTSQITFC